MNSHGVRFCWTHWVTLDSFPLFADWSYLEYTAR